MRRIVVAVLAALASTALVAQPTPADGQQRPSIGPEALDDDFDGPELSPSWKLFHARGGWPNKLKVIDVGVTTPGVLHLQPYHSAWVRDLNAPFVFKTIEGDFDIRARVRVRGADEPIPGGTWSLGGLMARVPNGLIASNWEPRHENWHFITTGVGHIAKEPVTETKSTYNSYSSLKLRAFQTGWVELRLVRIGMAMFALARPDGDAKWQLRDRFYRMEQSPAIEVGFIAYTTSDDMPPMVEDPEIDNRLVNTAAKVDAIFEVDWIRGKRPRVVNVGAERSTQGTVSAPDWYTQVSGANPLTDANLPEARVLEIIGS